MTEPTLSETLLQRGKAVSLNTYTLKSQVLSHGQGAYVYDLDGNEYLDFAAGIAVAALGHNHPAVVQSLAEQAQRLMICPASFLTQSRVELAEKLVNSSCADKVFFCNSGTEAIEGAIKLARLWAHQNRGSEVKDLIAFGASFHGRTYGAVSITEKARLYPEFGPYLPGVQFAEFNDIDSVKALITENTAAIVIEPIQGEGGIQPATPEFLTALRELCDQHKIVLIFDEIQCGVGRTGQFFAHRFFDVEPDIVTLAKGLGAGFPIGAMLAKDSIAEAMTPGKHGSTFGGNPLAVHVANAVIDVINTPVFLEHVRETSKTLLRKLKEIAKQSPLISEVRGIGLMVGVDFIESNPESPTHVNAIINGLRDAGMIATRAGQTTLRLTPPLNIGAPEVDHAVQLIEHVVAEAQQKSAANVT